jgi:hypothetical protein
MINQFWLNFIVKNFTINCQAISILDETILTAALYKNKNTFWAYLLDVLVKYALYQFIKFFKRM